MHHLRIGGGLLAICAALAVGAYALGYTTKGAKARTSEHKRANMVTTWPLRRPGVAQFGQRDAAIDRREQWSRMKPLTEREIQIRVSLGGWVLDRPQSRKFCTYPALAQVPILRFLWPSAFPLVTCMFSILALATEHQCVISQLSCPKTADGIRAEILEMLVVRTNWWLHLLGVHLSRFCPEAGTRSFKGHKLGQLGGMKRHLHRCLDPDGVSRYWFKGFQRCFGMQNTIWRFFPNVAWMKVWVERFLV